VGVRAQADSARGVSLAVLFFWDNSDRAVRTSVFFRGQRPRWPCKIHGRFSVCAKKEEKRSRPNHPEFFLSGFFCQPRGTEPPLVKMARKSTSSSRRSGGGAGAISKTDHRRAVARGLLPDQCAAHVRRSWTRCPKKATTVARAGFRGKFPSNGTVRVRCSRLARCGQKYCWQHGAGGVSDRRDGAKVLAQFGKVAEFEPVFSRFPARPTAAGGRRGPRAVQRRRAHIVAVNNDALNKFRNLKKKKKDADDIDLLQEAKRAAAARARQARDKLKGKASSAARPKRASPKSASPKRSPGRPAPKRVSPKRSPRRSSGASPGGAVGDVLRAWSSATSASFASGAGSGSKPKPKAKPKPKPKAKPKAGPKPKPKSRSGSRSSGSSRSSGGSRSARGSPRPAGGGIVYGGSPRRSSGGSNGVEEFGDDELALLFDDLESPGGLGGHPGGGIVGNNIYGPGGRSFGGGLGGSQ
jgi:hypothetical protein